MLRIRSGALRRVGIQSHKPSPAGVLELVKRQLSWRGAIVPRKPQKKSLALRVFQQVPGGVGLRRRRRQQHRRRWPWGFSRVLFSAGCGCTRVNEEQRLPLASEEELECPNLQYDANPPARLESGRGNNHFKMNPSNSWMG